MGPPGVGKGTQAKILSKILNVTHLSTGEILRNEIKMNTEIGKIAKSFIDHGNFVPDNIILDIIYEKISIKASNKGYLFDGFPRTIPQATGFDKLLIEMGEDLKAAINLTADENELIKRIIDRGKSSGRSDEAIDIVKKRQKIYWEETAPLLDFYDKRGLLITVDGLGDIDIITKRIFKVLK